MNTGTAVAVLSALNPICPRGMAAALLMARMLAPG